MGAQQNVVFIASIVEQRKRTKREIRRKIGVDRFLQYWGGKRDEERRNMLRLSNLREKKRERRAREYALYECSASA